MTKTRFIQGSLIIDENTAMRILSSGASIQHGFDDKNLPNIDLSCIEKDRQIEMSYEQNRLGSNQVLEGGGASDLKVDKGPGEVSDEDDDQRL